MQELKVELENADKEHAKSSYSQFFRICDLDAATTSKLNEYLRYCQFKKEAEAENLANGILTDEQLVA